MPEVEPSERMVGLRTLLSALRLLPLRAREKDAGPPLAIRFAPALRAASEVAALNTSSADLRTACSSAASAVHMHAGSGAVLTERRGLDVDRNFFIVFCAPFSSVVDRDGDASDLRFGNRCACTSLRIIVSDARRSSDNRFTVLRKSENWRSRFDPTNSCT